MEVAELDLKPLLPDSRSLAPDASPSQSSENPVMGPQPGQRTVSHPTCPLRIKIECEYVKGVMWEGEGVRVRGFLNLNFPASLSAVSLLHLTTILLAVWLPHPRLPAAANLSVCIFLLSLSPPGSLPQTPAHFKDVSTL